MAAWSIVACAATPHAGPSLVATAVVSPAPVAPAPTEQAALPAPPGELWPAGTCGFDPYLDGACSDRGAPRFAVVLGQFASGQVPARHSTRAPAKPRVPAVAEDELAHAERALAEARGLGLPPGYPLVLSWDDLPARGENRRGLALVAGLFGARAPAERWARARGLSAEIVELAPAGAAQPTCEDDYEACMASRVSAVEVFVPTRAYDAQSLEALVAQQDELPWVRFELAVARREKALEAVPAACEIEVGRVFLAPKNRLYRFLRQYAPVRCRDGREAWIPWRATRLESVVTPGARGPELHQVVLVECDVPTLEGRPFVPKIPAMVLAQGAGCPG